MRSKKCSDSGRLIDGSNTPSHGSGRGRLATAPFVYATAPFVYATAPFVYATAPFVYEGEVRSQILSLKYANKRSIARHLGHHLAVHIQEHIGIVDIVTWAPTVRSHRRKRGVDQAELLARQTARELGVPCRELLIRLNSESQTGKSRAERLVQPLFRARAPSDGASVVIIDDVITTGATLRAATRALQQAGVSEVFCVAVARTRGYRSF